MAKYRARFNDKARAGGVAKRNALKAKRQKQFHREEDPEQAEKARRIHEQARPESEARKRVRMAMQFPEKANAAKKKRLEKYIDRQVRKDEKAELLRKLARTQKQVNSAELQSLGALGQGSKAKTDSGEEEADEESEEEIEEEETKMEESNSESDHSSDHDSDMESEAESDQESESGSEMESDQESSDDHLEAPKPSSNAKPAAQPSVKPSTQPGTGFGFANLPVIKKKPKVSWKEKLGFTAADELLKANGGGSDSEEESDSEDESEEDSGEEGEDGSEDGSEEDSEDGSEEEEESEDNGESAGKQFAEWANKQTRDEESSAPTPIPANYKHTPRETESQQAVKALAVKKPGWVERLDLEPVVVNRSEEVSSARLNLPAVACEQEIMDAINHFDSVVVTGATGSGKTTQIPQFLFENGYAEHGIIGVTQPRRVAAVSMAKRIGEELEGACEVGYQIRFDARVGPKTKIKLMTDGVLLKELSSDFLLSKYSVIVIDEAHERSVNTDILVGLLSRVVKMRRKRFTEGTDSQLKPLKLIVMSATLRVGDFVENQRLFSDPPPVVSVESRQFPVTNHFSRRTATDYVEEAVKKVRRIHERLPKGGILVFLTGKNDIQRAIAELQPTKTITERTVVRINPETATVEEEAVEVEVEDDEQMEMSSSERSENDDDEESDMEIDDEDRDEEHDQKQLHVLPLHSLLSTEDQMKVFAPVPRGHRLCVVATNVAETSLTIPGIRYVVDCGRAKTRVYDSRTGVQKYAIRWVSQASADQRAGRAGRTGPGHCYRLYSSAMYERAFPKFGEPEIARMPVESLVLQMKAMGLSKLSSFPFPTPVPDPLLNAGVRVLQNLGALDAQERITSLGEQMAMFPLHPRQAKMLLIGNQHGCLPYVVALVAAMSVQDVMLPPKHGKEEKEEDDEQETKLSILDDEADVLQLLSACLSYFRDPTPRTCEHLRLRARAMREIASLRDQLARLLAHTLKRDAPQSLINELCADLARPSVLQRKALRQIVAAAYIDQVAARQALVDPRSVTRTSKMVSRQPYVTANEGPVVYIHPDTVMERAPDYVVYRTLEASEHSDKVRIRPLTAITPQQISALASSTPLITYSKPLGGAYAPRILGSSQRREAWVVPRFGKWDLPPKKVVQERRNGQWVNST